MDNYSYVANADVNYLDNLYENYRQSPESVDPTWQKFFEGFDFAIAKYGEEAHLTANGNGAATAAPATTNLEKEVAVQKLIHAYRGRAHLRSKTNPIRTRKDRSPYLDLEDFGLSDADLDTPFQAGSELGLGTVPLKRIIEALKKIYEGTIGFEYLHIRHADRLKWFREMIEQRSLKYKPEPENVKRILTKLNEAVVFESFLHTKYIGQKRFSLEGGETTIAALDALINTAAELGGKEIVIGMAHRGRLNVLANTMGKTYEHIFNEFEGNVPDQTMGDGDVKYHMGYSSEVTTPKGKTMYLKLAPNPSHLEAVNPVVEGYVRAKGDRLYDGDFKNIIPVLIHGDAAVAGQGVVYEVAQMMKLKGYSTGGTIHFVINNQVGFTTDFEDARSSIYSTDVAKVIDAPVFHVNGDDPEAVVFCMNLAIEYRQRFQRDVFVDMVCYRRHGHNEADEPKFTQPQLYNLISKHPNPREVYNEQLLLRGDLGADVAKKMDKEFRALLQDRLNMVKQKPLPYHLQPTEKEWQELRFSEPKDFDTNPKTSIDKKTIDKIGQSLVKLPDHFKPLKQIDVLLKRRKEMFEETRVYDWATAELLAYGSLIEEGKLVRMTGQDVERGTFSHRHAILKDAETNEAYNSLNHIDPKQSQKFEIYNSLLSENAVLGFEFGYAMANPNALVIWEAQFGDFVNGAQVVIDQFICASETKWQRQSGLVMLLPHGHEGQGPEHSSARLERFLKMCADYNIIVANFTTPANLFHAMRRQLAWPFRKPLVVMSPKSLLRHPKVVSEEVEFTKGEFQEIIDDSYVDPKGVKRIVMCSGKIYYDLLEVQQKDERKDIALVRLEQIYPIHFGKLEKVLKRYPKAEFVWVQEEPGNNGAWGFILRSLYTQIDRPLRVISRPDAASPAVGYANMHAKKQAEILRQAFEI